MWSKEGEEQRLQSGTGRQEKPVGLNEYGRCMVNIVSLSIIKDPYDTPINASGRRTGKFTQPVAQFAQQYHWWSPSRRHRLWAHLAAHLVDRLRWRCRKLRQAISTRGARLAQGVGRCHRHDVELPIRKSSLGASENECVLTMFVLRASEAMIFRQKERWMSWVPAFQPLDCAPFGKFELNSNFPKFYFG